MKSEHNAKKLRGYFKDPWASEYLAFGAVLSTGTDQKTFSYKVAHVKKFDMWWKWQFTSLTESGLFSSI